MIRDYFSILLFLHLFMLGTITIYGQTTAIPDTAFEQALIDLGIDSDVVVNGSVATADVESVTILDISNRYIILLTGIEDFTSLTELYCQNNNLFDVNVSHNTNLKILNCSNQYDDWLEPFTLNVTQNTALEYLNCSNNRDLEGGLNPSLNPNLKTLICSYSGLTGLNVSQNTKLEYLNCESNYYIVPGGDIIPFTNLTIGQNSNLKTIVCGYNEIASLDITDVPNLTYLNCAGNKLAGLNLSQNTALEKLHCHYNQLLSLHLVQNNALTELICNNNQLNILNVKNGNNTALTVFNSQNNPPLTCIEVDNSDAANASETPYDNWLKDDTATYLEDCENSTAIPDANFEQALIYLGIDSDGIVNGSVATMDIAGITSLDLFHFGIQDLTGIEDFISLNNLFCYDNELTYLNVSKNLNLEDLNCGKNLLTSIDLSQNTNLINLSCGENQLSGLDLSQNTNLEYLNCGINELTDLDVSYNTNLQGLECFANQLTLLDISLNVNVKYLLCEANNLTSLNVKNGNNIFLYVNALSNPYLKCIQVDDADAANASEAPYNNWAKDDIAVYSENCSALSVNDEILAESVILYPNPVTNTLTIDSEMSLTKVEIFSVLGKKVKEIDADFNSIKLQVLSSGLYLVRIHSEKGIAIRKLIKY